MGLGRRMNVEKCKEPPVAVHKRLFRKIDIFGLGTRPMICWVAVLGGRGFMESRDEKKLEIKKN